MRRCAVWVAMAALLSGGLGGCTRDEDTRVDLETARKFDSYPLYWAGERFEGLEISHVNTGGVAAAGFTYGTCDISGDHGCAAPLQIQVFPLCFHLDLAGATWKKRKIRGAPVGVADGAPVMFTRRVEIKVYRGQGSDAGLALRALHALRSFNDVSPRIGLVGSIPPPAPGVLEGTAPCSG